MFFNYEVLITKICVRTNETQKCKVLVSIIVLYVALARVNATYAFSIKATASRLQGVPYYNHRF